MTPTEETQQRLYNAAEAFYYAGILTSLPFDAAHVDAGALRNAEWAARAAIAGPDRRNGLGAPPLINFSFAIELYLKLLITLGSGKLKRGHDLHALFLKLEEAAPSVAACLIRNHAYARGCRAEFIEILKDEALVFQQWRYAHEQEFLCSSADTFLMIADACRQTVCELKPDLRSAFSVEAAPGAGA